MCNEWMETVLNGMRAENSSRDWGAVRQCISFDYNGMECTKVAKHAAEASSSLTSTSLKSSAATTHNMSDKNHNWSIVCLPNTIRFHFGRTAVSPIFHSLVLSTMQAYRHRPPPCCRGSRSFHHEFAPTLVTLLNARLLSLYLPRARPRYPFPFFTRRTHTHTRLIANKHNLPIHDHNYSDEIRYYYNLLYQCYYIF